MSTEALLPPLSRPSASPRQSASRYNTLRGALPASGPRAVQCSCAELKDLLLQTQRITGPSALGTSRTLLLALVMLKVPSSTHSAPS